MHGSRLHAASICAALLAQWGCADDPQPLSPQEALSSFRIAEGFRIELFASEPHVVDPVEMAFDENGGVYVAELLDNPEDPPKGTVPRSRIKYLEDSDGDGIVDKHTVFADGLLAVEGIAPWKGGLVATAAPDILYLKDTDGDHRSDIRETLYTGFSLAHVETRLSNPRLGLDNWFYLVNHGYPGKVTSPSRPDLPPVNVRSREFRFHPLRELAEASTGDAQFGQSYNQWGHWFITQNTQHIRHTVVPPGYLERNPFYALEDTEQDISDHGRPAATVFPISRPQQWRIERTVARQRRYAETRPGRDEKLEGFFTAASGSTVYLGDTFPDRFAGSVFVGEGNGNLVHCDLLGAKGATYSASRWPEGIDFLASTDNWFRPVNFSNAPDGNLYVLDYYRQYLEHPMFIPDAIKRRLNMDFTAGDTLGRIYRIVPDSRPSRPQETDLGSASSQDLAKYLGHANGWHRRTAHRLLIERQDGAIADRLLKLAGSDGLPEARLHALWVLEGIESLNADLIEALLDDPHPAIRENALRLAETFESGFSDAILHATRDKNPRVAFQATLAAGSLPLSIRSIQALAAVLARFPDDRWFGVAVLSAPADFAFPVLSALVERHAAFFEAPAQARREYVRSASSITGARRVPSEIRSLLAMVRHSRVLAGEEWQLSAAEGLEEGMGLQEGLALPASAAGPAFNELIRHASARVRDAMSRIARFFDLEAEVQAAIPAALGTSKAVRERVAATRILQGGEFSQVVKTLETLLFREAEPELQLEAARVLGSFDDPRAARSLIKTFPRAPASVRDGIAESLIRREGHALALLQAVAEQQIRADEIPAVHRIRLTQHPSEPVRRAAATTLAAADRDRDEVVREYLDVLDLDANSQSGRAVFDRECANCHLSRASRGRIGPDLSGVSNRSKEDLLTSILDPSYAIEDRYRNHLLATKDGRFFDGILVAETAVAVRLRGEANDISILKEDIADLRQSNVSLMPEGLEDAVTRRELADLIAYLQAGV